MSAAFIAVQCCQCSTMQVKQKKKSSNKWSCVVCNEKQSVRKVFAQGFMAKDVRKYVQTFNMSRQFAEQLSDQQQTLAASPEPEEIMDVVRFNQKKKHTDWSEYIDYEKDVEIEDVSEDVFEPNIVTELPKALFKKPKLSNSVGNLDTEDGEKPITPVFRKRNAGKETSTSRGGALRKDAFDWSDCKRKAVQNFGNKEPLKSQPSTARAVSKWSDHMIAAKEDEEDNFANKGTWKNESSMVKGASRWNEFITDEDDLVLERGKEFGDRMGRWNRTAAFETTIDAQIVEDDAAGLTYWSQGYANGIDFGAEDSPHASLHATAVTTFFPVMKEDYSY